MESDTSVFEFLFSGAMLALFVLWWVLVLVAGWQMYVKAGQRGWVALIPIVNVLGLLRIIHKPWWWILLLLIPIVNLVVLILMFNALSKAFGQGIGTTLVLLFFAPIGYLYLGFGAAQYQLQPDPLFG